MIQIGQKAPDFKLVDTEKKDVTLDQFKGKNLVMFFFPMAWTGVCTKEVCSVQNDYKVFAGLNAEVVGVSVDTLFALKHFGEDNKLTYPLLSDFNKDAIKAFDIVHHDFAYGYKDVAKRATFLIDKEGVLRYAEVLPNLGDFPNMDKLKEELALLA